jgi:hypothetical protein
MAQQETPTVDVTEQDVEEAANKALSDVFLAGAAFGIGTLIALMVQREGDVGGVAVARNPAGARLHHVAQRRPLRSRDVLANDGATLRA